MTLAVAEVLRPNKPNLDMTLAVAEAISHNKAQTTPHYNNNQHMARGVVLGAKRAKRPVITFDFRSEMLMCHPFFIIQFQLQMALQKTA